MNADVIKQFLVGLGFQIDTQGLKKFTGALTEATLKAMAVGAAVTTAAATVVAGITKIANEYDELDQLAMRFRSSASAIDEFSDISEVLGIGSDKAQAALSSLDRAISQTSMGFGRAKVIFEQLGISVVDAAGKMRPTLEVMAELNKKFATMERGKAINIMERLGIDPEYIRAFEFDLAKISKDLEDIDKAANFDLNTAVVEGKAYAHVWKEVGQQVRLLWTFISKVFQSIAVNLMPQLRESLGTFKRTLERFRHFLMDNVNYIRQPLEFVAKFILGLMDSIGQLAGRAMQIVEGIASAFLSLFQYVNPVALKFMGILAAITVAWRALNGAFLMSPVGIVLELGAAILLLYDDYQTWKEGGQSLIDWGKWGPGINMAIAGIKSLRDALIDVAAEIIAVVDALGKLIKFDFKGAGDSMRVAANLAEQSFGDIGSGIKNLFGAGAYAVTLGNVDLSKPAPIAPSPKDEAELMPNISNPVGATINQKTEININGDDMPNISVAKEVASQQNRVNADLVRNMKGLVR